MGRLRVGRRGRSRRSRLPPTRSRPGARPRSRSAPTSCSASGTWSTITAGSSPRCSPRSTARCRRTRWARSPAASRTSSSRAASRTCMKGGLQRAGELGRRRLPDPPAAGCRGGHHAVQLPGDGADVDVRHGDRDAATRSSSSRPRRTPRRRCSSPSCCTRRACPTACSTSSRATRSRSTGSSSTRTIAAVSFVGSTPDRPLHLRDRHEARQARAGAGRREEPHGRAAGRGRGHGRRCRDLRGLRLGGRAVHGDRDGGRRRATSPTRWSTRSRPGWARSAWVPASDPEAEMGPLVTEVSIATRSRPTSTAPATRARRSSPTGASTRCTRTRTGSSWASR